MYRRDQIGRLLVALLVLVTMAGGAKLQAEELGWKEHWMRVGDGRGGWTFQKAELQVFPDTCPFGLAHMDNGETILMGMRMGTQITISAWSKDAGDTWSEWTTLPDAEGNPMVGRPMMLAYLGQGHLTFATDQRFLSSDYGRTWPERLPVPPALNGSYWGVEGNPLIDRGADGKATALAEIAYNYPPGRSHPKDHCDVFMRWSYDGGRTWEGEQQIATWEWQETSPAGNTYTRGVSEGSLTRAGNGWLVAALRTDVPARYLEDHAADALEGTAVAISEDNGQTWSQLHHLYDAGRHHAHLLTLPDGRIVMTYIVRTDVRDGKLASYQRGLEALVSTDNGVTWDTQRRYVLDEFAYLEPSGDWTNGMAGHLYSALLPDGRILSAYGNYQVGTVLIRWKP